MKVLIISDNIFLLKKFISIINNHSVKYDIAVSPTSDVETFKHQITQDLKVLDLKNHETITVLIKQYDIIFSIHCKQLFPEKLVNTVKCINIHPGYNPINRGWYPQIFSIVHNLPIGATIHEMDKELDNGNIIDRAYVEKEITDTSETLYNKILEKEIYLLKKNLKNILNQTYQTVTPENKGNLFLKKDFNQLCEIDLNEKNTMLYFINKLRALSHGNLKNAYFIDPTTGKKIFITIRLEKEES